MITLFHIQGYTLKIAAPPLGGSQGTKGEQAAEEQRRGRAFSVLISLSNAVATQVTSESTARSERCFESGIDPFDGPPGVDLTLMFPDSECS